MHKRILRVDKVILTNDDSMDIARAILKPLGEPNSNRKQLISSNTTARIIRINAKFIGFKFKMGPYFFRCLTSKFRVQSY
jgi:hypothetical protein